MGDSHPGRPDGAGPDTGRTGPTDEERAAAADVLRMIWGIASHGRSTWRRNLASRT